LTAKQVTALKGRAARQGISMAEVIRRAVDRTIADDDPMQDPDARRRALEAAGSVRTGLPDLSDNHDAYLAEAYSQ
jgi:hypothetical protein